MKLAARRGMTIFEVVCGILALVGVFGGVVLIQATLMKSLTTSALNGALSEKASRALEALVADARWAQRTALVISTENGADRLDLRVPLDWVADAPVWSSTITYRVETSAIDANDNGAADDFRFVRVQDGTTRVLCNNVAAGGFSAVLDGDRLALQIQIEQMQGHTGRLVTTDARTSVNLRN
jgi:hypothetical protein